MLCGRVFDYSDRNCFDSKVKLSLIFAFPLFIIVGCGSPNLDDPDYIIEILAEATDLAKLQKRGGSGKELLFKPNEQSPFTGWGKKIYSNGQVRELVQFEEGKKNGVQTCWYQNGQKNYERNYLEGKYNGQYTDWHYNGQKKVQRYHKNGKEDGMWTEWYENGQKSLLANWKDGLLISAEVWKPNGKMCTETNFNLGNGLVFFYYENGQKKWKSTFNNGTLINFDVFK